MGSLRRCCFRQTHNSPPAGACNYTSAVHAQRVCVTLQTKRSKYSGVSTLFQAYVPVYKV